MILNIGRKMCLRAFKVAKMWLKMAHNDRKINNKYEIIKRQTVIESDKNNYEKVMSKQKVSKLPFLRLSQLSMNVYNTY